MPIHLPYSRRQFLRRTLAGGALLLTCRALEGAELPLEERWALLSDPHIDADTTLVDREVNMSDHLRAAVAEVAALSPAPAQVLVNGDCAHRLGLAEDYTQFVSLLKPFREKGLSVHCTMGNHDAREPFLAASPEAAPPPLPGRHLSIIESPLANWFLLDSLVTTNQTPGLLGEEQLRWLAQGLDARPHRPAILAVHHNPMIHGPDTRPVGITDTAELLAVVEPRRQVKAIIFGHTYTWHLEEKAGLHFINLPAVGYNFKEGEVTGWIDAHLRPDGLKLEVHAQDKAHPQHGQIKELAWRG